MDRRTLLTASAAVIGSTVTGCLEGRGFMGDSNTSGGGGGKTGDTGMNNSSDGGGSADNGTKESSETNDDSGNNNEVTGDEDSEATKTDQEDTASDFEARFEVLNIDYTGSPTERASVTFENQTVNITGAVSGSNSCYTARLDAVTIEDRALVVQIESFEDAAENEGCRDAIVEIEYQMSIKITGELPPSVRVEHNGEHVTTEQSS